MKSSAPSFRVPPRHVVSVEHPFLVQNVEKAIEMLGGDEEIEQSLQPEAAKPLGLRFRPDDPASRTVLSFNNQTNNLLLQLTVPKRTGRKRKRGSNEPFVDDSSRTTCRKDAAYLLRSLSDNPQKYQADIVGTINSTHIWRAVPDFVYTSKGSTFLDEIKSKILPKDFLQLQQWSLPKTYGLTDTENFPPPVLSTQVLPHNYTYRQNPAVKQVADPNTGETTLHNIQTPLKLFTLQRHHYEEWPSEPSPDCPPLSEQPAAMQEICNTLRVLFEERPIWTRRALVNQFPLDVPEALIRQAFAYVAFAIRSGPWRDAICKFGVDPRTDRCYRKYQTVLIMLVSKDKDKGETREDFARKWVRSTDRESHIFTGTKSVPSDGKVWQLCDLQEPHLKSLVDIPELYLRNECETRYFGWYANGTNAKIKVALKACIEALIARESLDIIALEKFLKLPEHLAYDQDMAAAQTPKDASKKEQEWASSYRAMCRTQAGSLPQAGGSGRGRLSKPKPSMKSSFIDVEGSQELEDLAAVEDLDDENDNDNAEEGEGVQEDQEVWDGEDGDGDMDVA